MNGKVVNEFVGLKPKMYSLIDETEALHKFTGKGIHNKILKKYKHDTFKDCLFNKTVHKESCYTIQNDKHFSLHTVKLEKNTLSPTDDKRYKLDDGVSSLAHGHYLIPC